MSKKQSSARPRKPGRNRLLLTEEAARMMIEEGIRDCSTARRKAADRLGMDRADWPDEREIEAACAARVSLFSPDSKHLRDEKLDCAEAGLALLADFSPRLTGQLVHGPVLRNSVIEIHAFADTLEDVLSLLAARQLTGALQEKTFYFRRGEATSIPTIQLDIDSHEVEISVFAVDDIRNKPLAPGHLKPMQRLSLSQLAARRSIRGQR